MEAKRDASLAEADLVVSKSVIGLTTADRMSSVVDFLRNHVARPGRNSPPRRVRPSGVLATGRVKPPGWDRVENDPSYRARTPTPTARPSSRRRVVTPPPWPLQHEGDERSGTLRILPVAPKARQDAMPELRSMTSTGRRLDEERKKLHQATSREMHDEDTAVLQLPRLLGRRFVDKAREKREGSPEDIRYRATVRRTDAPNRSPDPLRCGQTEETRLNAGKHEPEVLMEWVTDRYHVVQLRMSRSDRDTPGKGCVTIAVRPFKGAPGKSSLMKPRVKNVGDGLLTQLEEQKKRIDHISRATAAERARAAASRAPSPAVVRNRLDSELDRLLSPDGLKMADPDAKDTFLDYEKAAEAGAERDEMGSGAPERRDVPAKNLALKVLRSCGLDKATGLAELSGRSRMVSKGKRSARSSLRDGSPGRSASPARRPGRRAGAAISPDRPASRHAKARRNGGPGTSLRHAHSWFKVRSPRAGSPEQHRAGTGDGAHVRREGRDGMRASDRREGSPGGTLQLLVPFAGKAEMGGERRRGSGLLAVLHGFGVDGEAEETEEERDDDSEDVDVIQQPRNGKGRRRQGNASGLTPDMKLRPSDKDAIAYGIKKLPMRWSKEQVDIIKRVWETIDLDLDQKVTRVELEAWLEQKIEVQGAGQYGGDGVGIGLAKLMAKAGMRKKHEIHFRDMIKVFFTGGMVKAPYITDTDIEAMCEYAYPKAPPPPPLSGDEEAMMRILWNIWRPDPDQAYITLDDLIRSQPDVPVSMVRILFAKLDRRSAGRVYYRDLVDWFQRVHVAKHEAEMKKAQSVAIHTLEETQERYRSAWYSNMRSKNAQSRGKKATTRAD